MMGQWPPLREYPRADRQPKPRSRGLTMVIDKGLGLAATKDLVEMAGHCMDFYKFGFGTSAIYPPDILREKVRFLTEQGLYPYPGGTFLEVAVLQRGTEVFFRQVKEMGFRWVEVSDGTIPLSVEEKCLLIAEAAGWGFHVLAEVGKKEKGFFQGVKETLREVKELMAAGASYVIMEGRESGKGVHFYDDAGKIKEEEWTRVVSGIEDMNRIIWEAPLKEQQQELIGRFGTNVNLGNIHPHEVIALEALRLGLRSDSLAPLIQAGYVS